MREGVVGTIDTRLFDTGSEQQCGPVWYFSKGLRGELRHGNLVVFSGNSYVATGILGPFPSQEDFRTIEQAFCVRLLGSSGVPNENMALEAFFGGRMIDFFRVQMEFDTRFLSIHRSIKDAILGTDEASINMLSTMPIAFAECGINPDFDLSRDDFERFLSSKNLYKERWGYQAQNRAIYLFDLLAVLSDLQSYVYSVPRRFGNAMLEQSRFADGICADYAMKRCIDRESATFKHFGYQSDLICSLFADTLVAIYAALDTLAKLIFESLRESPSFENPVKLKSMSKYFTDCDQLTKLIPSSCLRRASLIEHVNDFKELQTVRDTIVHNGFLMPRPTVFFGKGGKLVGNHDLYFSFLPMWDIAKEGSPVRWLNRYRFYAMNQLLDEYVLKWVTRFLSYIGPTLEILEGIWRNRQL